MPEESGHRWFAATYHRTVAPAERSFMRQVRQEVAGKARGNVLEIGAGTGLNFAYYTDGASSIAATEPDPFMLRRAQERAREAAREIDLRQAPAAAPPFPPDSFG